jgi:hypothetical protein
MIFRRGLLVLGLVAIHCKSAQSKGPEQPVALAEKKSTAACNCAPATVVYEKQQCPALPTAKPEKTLCPPAAPEKICPELKPVQEPKCVQAAVNTGDPVTPVKSPLPRLKDGLAFANLYEEKTFFERMALEHQKFGKPAHIKRAKKKKFRGALIEQRSGRKRLYDHNLFLRRLFAGKLELREYGKLSEQFEGAVFLDIGSAILSDEGAVTVRDLYEDKKVSPHLTLLASDINDKSSPKHRYIDIYRKQKKQLPFDVVEVSALMTDVAKFTSPLEGHLTSADRSVMLRAANSGPDLYYDAKQVRKHLIAAIEAFEDRHLLYFFNKFILYKPRAGSYFMLVAEIDETVGTNHKETPWEDIEWSARKFEEGIFLNRAYW